MQLCTDRATCLDPGAEVGRGHTALAPLTPGIMKTKLELEASNAIAGMLPHLHDFTALLLLLLPLLSRQY